MRGLDGGVGGIVGGGRWGELEIRLWRGVQGTSRGRGGERKWTKCLSPCLVGGIITGPGVGLDKENK